MFPRTLEDLIRYFEQFPGVGRRTAERFATFILGLKPEEVKKFSQILLNVSSSIKPCKMCNNITDKDVCSICEDSSRNSGLICLVEDPWDVIAIEKTGKFKGKYYVLLGNIAPLEHRGPESLHLRQLMNRIEKNEIKEVIIATDSDAEGEVTATYLINLLKDKGVVLSRIGMGLPMGADLELVDIASLSKALENRKVLDKTQEDQ